MANWDYSKIGPKPLPLQVGKISPTGQQIARDVRLKGYADDTKEAMARIVEWADILNSYAVEVNETAKVLYEEYYRQFTDVLKELSEDKDYHSLPEISAARGGFDTLGERLNYDLGDENILRLVHQVVSEGDNIFTPVGLEQFMVAQNGAWKI